MTASGMESSPLDPEPPKDASPGEGVRVFRLKRRKEYLAVAATRRKWVTPGIILQIRPRKIHGPGSETVAESGAGGVRPSALGVGFTASKKVGNAVARNRARRRLKALVQAVFATHAMPQHDYVLIARQETVSRPFAALRQDLLVALKRLGALQAGAGASRREKT